MKAILGAAVLIVGALAFLGLLLAYSPADAWWGCVAVIGAGGAAAQIIADDLKGKR